MAHNDSSDQEQEMERTLRGYFASDRPGLQAPDDLWQRLESRLGEQSAPSRLSAIGDNLWPRTGRLWSPAFATAGVAAAAVVVTVSVWAATGGFTGQDPQEELASMGDRGATATAGATPAPREHVAATPAPREDIIVEPEIVIEEEVVMTEPTPAPAYAGGPEVLEEEVVMEVEMMAEATPAPAYAGGPEVLAEPEAAFDSLDPQVGSPPDTVFKDYGRLPFVDVFQDPVSTFSLDTDRTSYHLALNWARNGYQVEPESVRAEEWINAFDYGYDPPSNHREFAISSEITRHPLDSRLHLARVSFQAPDVRDDAPLNVTLVLDASGSMSDGNRVAIAREAAESIRRSLGPRDRIAVVHFTDSVIGHLTVEHSRPDDSSVVSSISSLAPHNATNVQAGLDLGVRLADRERRERPGAYNYIILMSDGVANVDATNPFAILESAYDRDSGNPLRIISVGVGINNYNDYLLEQLAQHGDGWYRYLSDTDQARVTFSRENWLALSVPFADQTRAQVTWDPEVVRSWRIIGYENRVTPDYTFTQDRKEFAELPSGAATTVFYELELHRQGSGNRRERLAGVEVRWVEPDTGESRRQSGQVVGSPNTAFQRHADPWLQFGAIVALSSDRYGGLRDEQRSHLTEASGDLTRLLDLLERLQPDLGELEAYNDFWFLLEHMSRGVREQAPEATPPSGYSR